MMRRDLECTPDCAPEILRLFAVEASVSDASRCLARARRSESRFRAEIIMLEDLVSLLSRRILDEANGR